jgi:GAF domain-containing protein
VPPGVTLSGKGAKSQTQGRNLRSTGTKAGRLDVSTLQAKAELIKKLKARTRDLEKRLRESLQQQTATSEVMGVISSSPGELEPVFDAVLENATRLCEAAYGNLYLRDGDAFRLAALHGDLPTEQYHKGALFRPAAGVPLARAAETRQPVHVADYRKERGYLDRDPLAVTVVEVAGIRTLLGVPMLSEGHVVGAIGVYRKEVRPFTDKQTELISNFASQAVIAIENARLLNELRQRTDDLSKALEQQTATSEVLQVISASSGDLGPVFNVMLESATRICAAKFGALYIYEGGKFRPAALASPSPKFEAYVKERGAFVPRPDQPMGRVLETKAVVCSFVDTKHGLPNAAFELGDARTHISVPMLKENDLVGAINIFRQEARAFTDKEIGLVQNFAAQAVIAIENTRLLNELRESLQQQTATSELLRVIASSPTDLQRVLDKVAKTAACVCGANDTVIRRVDGDALRLTAHYGTILSQETGGATPLDRSTAMGRAVVDRRTVHVHDMAAEREHEFWKGKDLANRFGYRTVLATPLLREGVATGAILIRRSEVKPFSESHIKLLEAFADQAAIAIENTRLFEAEQQRTRELTECNVHPPDVVSLVLHALC